MWADCLAHVATILDVDTTQSEQRTRQCIWLAGYEASMSAVHACRVAGISPSTLSHWTDPVFRELRTLADQRINDTLAGEAWRRGKEGVEQGIWHHGKLVGTERKYSDKLLEMMLRNRDPERWGEQRTQQAADDSAARMLRKVLADPKAYALLQEAAAQLALGAGAEEAIIVEPSSSDVVTP